MLSKRIRKTIETGKEQEGKCVGCGDPVAGALVGSEITLFVDKAKELEDRIVVEELCVTCTKKICEGKLKDIT